MMILNGHHFVYGLPAQVTARVTENLTRCRYARASSVNKVGISTNGSVAARVSQTHFSADFRQRDNHRRACGS